MKFASFLVLVLLAAPALAEDLMMVNLSPENSKKLWNQMKDVKAVEVTMEGDFGKVVGTGNYSKGGDSVQCDLTYSPAKKKVGNKTVTFKKPSYACWFTMDYVNSTTGKLSIRSNLAPAPVPSPSPSGYPTPSVLPNPGPGGGG